MMLLWVFLVLLIGGVLAWLAEARGGNWSRWISLLALTVDLALLLMARRARSFMSMTRRHWTRRVSKPSSLPQ